MTVYELIQALCRYDADTKVKIALNGSGYFMDTDGEEVHVAFVGEKVDISDVWCKKYWKEEEVYLSTDI